MISSFIWGVIPKKVGNPSYFGGITVIFLKKKIFFRGKRFTFFVTVIGFFHESFPDEKKNDSYENHESFSPEKK